MKKELVDLSGETTKINSTDEMRGALITKNHENVLRLPI